MGIKQVNIRNADKENDPQTYAIIGAAIEVQRVLGTGYLEKVYQEAMAVELEEQLIPFQREVDLGIEYKWTRLSCAYRADFICYGEILVEIKVIARLTNIEYA